MTTKVVKKYSHSYSVVHSLSGHPSQDIFLSASKGEFKVWSSPSEI